jgi:hypothetical protein
MSLSEERKFGRDARYDTYRRHSAQDTGIRPGFRRCLGGGSLPEGEPEARRTSNEGALVCTIRRCIGLGSLHTGRAMYFTVR